jgi:hypothetical protein
LLSAPLHRPLPHLPLRLLLRPQQLHSPANRRLHVRLQHNRVTSQIGKSQPLGQA